LRLPPREGALSAAAFLEIVKEEAAATVIECFRAWKEREPKHSIVGIYAR
jgi:hypothetical protein